MNEIYTKSLKKGVSFIVCCYNSEAVLTDTLKAIINQSNREIPFELILVDNNCTDNTVAIAKSIWSRSDTRLHVVKEKTSGLSFARRRGVQKAAYHIISFVDDDNIIEPGWVKKVSDLFDNHMEVGAVGSYNLPLLETHEPDWFVKYMHSYACGKLYPDSGIVVGNKKKHLWGAGLSVRSKIIKKIYSENLSLHLTGRKSSLILAGDDSEICYHCRLRGWHLWYEHDLRLYHKIHTSRLTWEYLCKMHEGFGYSTAILDIYKRIIDDKLPHPYSVLFLQKLVTFLLIVLRYNFRLKFNKVGQDSQILYNTAWGGLKGAFDLRNSYYPMVEQIQKLSTSKD